VQEEPANMGAKCYIQCNLGDKYPLQYISRKPSASPATGFKKQSAKELQEILAKAFA
jgi:2-oxoglutarate dehydrogenase E1 component